MLTLSRLQKRFVGVAALRDVSMHFEPGMVYAVTGPNGSGKSTLLHTIAGFVTPDSGTVTLRHESTIDLTALSPSQRVRHGIGLVFQQPRTFADLTVLENVVLAAVPVESGSIWRGGLKPLLTDDAISGAEQLIRRVGLAAQSGLPASTLSYGQSKILDVVRVAARGASVWLLDEPFAGVDSETGRVLQQLIAAHVRSEPSRHLAVIVCHEPDYVQAVADVIVTLVDGDIAAVHQQSKRFEAVTGTSVH